MTQKTKKTNPIEENEPSCGCSPDCNCGCQEGLPCSCEAEKEKTVCDCGFEAKAEEYLTMAKRTQADFDNFRKKSFEAMQSIRFEGVVSVLEKFLPCLDAIIKAKAMIQDSSVLEGVEMIEREMKNALNNLDVVEIPSKGEKFNPKFHNVIAVVNDKSIEDDIITEVYQEGYQLKDRIVRYAQVVINKKN